MEDSYRFVRLQPFNKRSGHLCNRYMIGGQLFEAQRWYKLPKAWGDKLEPLLQSTGSRVFQILTETQYNEVMRSELAAAYMRAGVGVTFGASALQAPPPAAPPKSGPVASKLGRLKATEIKMGEDGVARPVAQSPAAFEDEEEEEEEAELEETDSADSEEAADKGEEMDLEPMTKMQLLATAEAYGVAVDARAKKEDIKNVLATALF